MKQGHDMAWAMIVRTAVFDEMILDRILERATSQGEPGGRGAQSG